MIRRLALGGVAVLFALLALHVFLKAGTTVRSSGERIFPGPAPCNTTLQACIDGSANGDVIRIQPN